MKIIRLSLAALGFFMGSLSASAERGPAQSAAPALTAYLGVKDALVATDGEKAKAQAIILSAALNNMKTANLSSTDKKALLMAKTHSTSISKTTDVKMQRDQFEMLSTSMIALTKATKPAKAYVQFCPMAANGKGASWLSDKKEVRNPYYGDKMLKCGSVKEEI